MKGIVIQLIGSSAALVVMACVVGHHWWNLESGGRIPGDAGWQVISTPADRHPEMIPVSTGGTPPAPRSREQDDQVESATVQALQEVVAALQSLKAENDDLRSRLMEINGEMNGLQIQIDGYDDEFRPLKLQPTIEGVIDSGNPLLPPKGW